MTNAWHAGANEDLALALTVETELRGLQQGNPGANHGVDVGVPYEPMRML